MRQLRIFTLEPYSPQPRSPSHPLPMDTFGGPVNNPPRSIPSTADPPALPLYCLVSSCGQPIYWDQVGLTPSKKTYSCPHCHFVFCLSCKEPPPAYGTHGSTSACLLNSVTPGALLGLLLFHETLLELKNLSEMKKELASLKQGEILDPVSMDEVDDVIARTEATMEDTRRIADGLYTIMMTEELKPTIKD